LLKNKIMASKTISFLKNKNRDFNNVLDSYLNLTDGGALSGALTSNTSIRQTGAAAPANSVGLVCNAIAVAADGFGVYEFFAEVDLGGHTNTATDNGLVKTVATIPADSKPIDIFAITTEVAGHDNTCALDLVTATTADTDTLDEAVTAVATYIDGTDFKSSAQGALGAHHTSAYTNSTAHLPASTGTSTTLAIINKGTGNGTAAMVSGKIGIYFKYVGSGPASADTRI
jgi:uncharacterized protein (UPF0264 family)